MSRLQGERELEVREPSAQSWREEDLHERMNNKIVGRVCVWVRTDSPATPLPKDHNCLNHQQSFIMKVVGIRQKRMTHGFLPLLAQGLKNLPHPYPHPWENHAPFDLVAATVAGCVHLINHDAYLHDGQHNICRMPRYTIGDKIKIQNIT